MNEIRVLCCRADAAQAAADPAVSGLVALFDRLPAGTVVDFVGARPGKEIDQLIAERTVVVGDDGDLAAVALRLMRKELLGRVIVGFATDRPSPVTDLYALPVGPAALPVALAGDPDLVPLVRDDVGGVLVGRGELAPVVGTIYVDERRVLHGPSARVVVSPDSAKGLEVRVVPRRFLGVGRRALVFPGRAVQIGTTETTVVSDGVSYARPMTRWTYYKHTEPLRLARGLV